MKIEDYNKYYIQGSDHYLIPKDEFKELFNEMLCWKDESKKQKEVINKIEEKIKENIKNAEYDIIALTITDREYYKYVDDMLNDLLQILENKEVSE